MIADNDNAAFNRNITRQNPKFIKYYLPLKKFHIAIIMSFVKVYIHFVWSTKNRMPFLDNINLRFHVWQHIRENAATKNIHIDMVNGYEDHCHCLVSLRADQSMEQVMQLIKGESSYWINKNSLCKFHFEWQRSYYAVSVSESVLERVRSYIRNQEQHHKRKKYKDEIDEFIVRYGFQEFLDKD